MTVTHLGAISCHPWLLRSSWRQLSSLAGIAGPGFATVQRACSSPGELQNTFKYSKNEIKYSFYFNLHMPSSTFRRCQYCGMTWPTVVWFSSEMQLWVLSIRRWWSCVQCCPIFTLASVRVNQYLSFCVAVKNFTGPRWVRYYFIKPYSNEF